MLFRIGTKCEYIFFKSKCLGDVIHAELASDDQADKLHTWPLRDITNNL